MRTLKQCLLDYDLVMLRAIAEKWDIELEANRQHEAALELAGRMIAPGAQAALAAVLTPAERQALEVVLSEGGQMPVGAFVRRFGEIRMMGPGRLERERPWNNPTSVAESLWYAGLTYRAFEEGPGGLHEVMYIPPELRALLQEQRAASSPPSPIVIPTVSPPERLAQPEGGLADDVCTLLAWAHQRPLSPPPCDAAWRRRHASLLAQSTRAFDSDSILQDYMEFSIHLAGQSGLLRNDGGRLRPAPQAVMKWLRAPLFEQMQTLFETWRRDPTWNELWRTPGLRCEDTGSWRNDPLAARAAVLDFVALMENERWHSLEGFVAAIKAHRPDFQRPGGDYAAWYIRDAHSGEYLRGFQSWDAVDGALVRYVLSGPLTWLGLVEVAEGSCRRTQTGTALLGKGEPFIRDGDARFEVSEEGMVRIGRARRFERFQLSRVADWRRREGEVWAYGLTPSSLARARQQRIGVERILQFLQESAGSPVPPVLVKALHRWEEKGAEAWASEAVVLRVARPELMEQLLNAPQARRLIREPLSSTAAAVSPAHWPALRQILLEMGILPDKTSRRV